MGMIVILQQLDEPATLGRAIAGAFLATLWGLIASNVIYLPLAGKAAAPQPRRTNLPENADRRYFEHPGR